VPRSFGNNYKSPPSSFGNNNYMKSPPSSFGNNYKSSPSPFGNLIKSPPSSNTYLKSPPSSYGSSPTFRKPVIRPSSDAPIVSPSRQPKGPDGTNGFSSEYRELRTRKVTET